MKKWMRLAGALSAVLWILTGITLIIWLTAGDGGYLGAQMLRYTDPAYTKLPEAEYPGMGNMVAGYLTGRVDEFQYQYTDASGKTVTCFQPHEEAHMSDCRELIRLDRTVMLLGGGALLILAGLCVAARRCGGDFCRGILWGLRAVIAAAAALMIWALADFNGFFVTFHRVAFTNDGWLLNPGTDMLIRLMPEEFFISLGTRGLIPAAFLPAAASAAARIGLRITRSKDRT